MTGHRTKPKKDRRKHPARCSPVLRPERIAGSNPAYPVGVPSLYGSGSLQRAHEPWSFCLRVSAVHALPLRRRHSGLSHSSLRLFYHSRAQKSMGSTSVTSSEEGASGQPSLDFPKRVEYNPSNISKAKAGRASRIERSDLAEPAQGRVQEGDKLCIRCTTAEPEVWPGAPGGARRPTGTRSGAAVRPRPKAD